MEGIRLNESSCRQQVFNYIEWEQDRNPSPEIDFNL